MSVSWESKKSNSDGIGTSTFNEQIRVEDSVAKILTSVDGVGGISW